MVDEASGAKDELAVVSEALAKRGAVGQFAKGIFDRIVDPATIKAKKGFGSEGDLTGNVAEKGAEGFRIRLTMPERYPIKVVIGNSDSAIDPNAGSSADIAVELTIEADKSGWFLIKTTRIENLRLDTAFGAWIPRKLSEVADMAAEHNASVQS